jgi:hypothetical protein
MSEENHQDDERKHNSRHRDRLRCNRCHGQRQACHAAGGGIVDGSPEPTWRAALLAAHPSWLRSGGGINAEMLRDRVHAGCVADCP